MRYTWILFDADGTLFDYDTAEAEALRKAFLAEGLTYNEEVRDIYRIHNSAVWAEFEKGEISPQSLKTERLNRLKATLEIEFDTSRMSEVYLEFLSTMNFLLPGAESAFEWCRSRASTGLVTNGLKKVQRGRLSRSVLKNQFDIVVISEEIGFAKPDRGVFDVAFRLMGNPPRDKVLIVGDSLTSDIQGGTNYGIDTCWISGETKEEPSWHDSTYAINNIGELIGILE